jgi:hypothetical protein
MLIEQPKIMPNGVYHLNPNPCITASEMGWFMRLIYVLAVVQESEIGLPSSTFDSWVYKSYGMEELEIICMSP